jgi:integrase
MTRKDTLTLGGLTVEAYGTQWMQRRQHLASARTEAAQLRLHVFPVIGHLGIVGVRPRHVRELIDQLRHKVSSSPKCHGGALSPRTVRHVFAVLRLMFKGAVIDEHIATSPIVVERGVLPKNVDKDPAWRSTAIFTRDELIAVISDPRIALYRRVFNALEGVAGLRHGEAAGLRWADYDPTCEPLGKLRVSRSGERAATKTHLAREIPVHPALRTILDEWWRSGWAAKYARPPTASDLIVPTKSHQVRKAPGTLKAFRSDLERLGLRPRRNHDLRRTFITLAQVDGASRDVLRPMTHPGEQDVVGLYTTLPWPVRCAAIAKLRIDLSAAGIDRLPSEPPQRARPRRCAGGTTHEIDL